MRLIFATALLASLPGLVLAQVPGTVGPPPDNRAAPGTEGPTIACRLFDFGCKPPPEPVAAPAGPAEDAAAPAPKHKPKPKTAKAKLKAGAAPQTDAEPASPGT